MTSGIYVRNTPPLGEMHRDDLIYLAATYESKGKIYTRGNSRRLVLNVSNKKQAQYISGLLQAKITILKMSMHPKNVYFSITLTGKKIEDLMILLKPYFKGDGFKI